MKVQSEVKREFRFKGIKLPDPNTGYTNEQVKDHYMGVYPDLLNTTATVKIEGVVKVTEFKPKTGTHG